MNKPLLFSYALWASSFLSFPLAAECVSTPDCADLGYDKTSCLSGDSVLKCPFNTSKLKCIPKTCETIGKKTCGENCVPIGYDGCCVGDIYYSDKTCSANLVSGKTPIGVVVALDTAYDDKSGNGIQWNCSGTDLSLTNYTDQTSAKTDFAGKANTQTIMNECSDRPIAASYCASYTKGGVSGWYLPAYGELYNIMYTNFSTVNTGLGKVSSNNKITSNYWYWSSSEYDSFIALGVYFGYNDWDYSSKNSHYNVRCVLAF